MVWYAGWADKLAQALGSSNPVAGPYFNFTVPEPTGVVGDPLLRTSRRCAASSRGSRRRSSVGTPSSASPRSAHPLAAVELAEVLATSDLPGGVVNILTGSRTSSRRGSPRTWT